MKIKINNFLNIAILFLIVTQCSSGNFNSPRATLETFFRAIRARNKNLCVSCFSKKDQQEIISNWDDAQIPDDFEYNILDEDIGRAAASITVEIITDDSKETENIWFIKELDG